MDNSKFVPSEQTKPPRSLTERLAETNGHVQIEAASFMAERFAPELPPLVVNDEGLGAPPVPPLQESAVGPMFAVPRERAPWANRMLLTVLLIVALVPSVAFAVLYWRGAANVPGSAPMAAERDDGQATPTVQQASVASIAPLETVLPKQDIELPSIALTVPGAMAAEAGKETLFALALDSPDELPVRSIITIRGLPEGTSFSAGRPYGESEWSLRPDEIGDLRLILPQTASGRHALSVELVAADGRMIASGTTSLEIASDPKAVFVRRPEDTARIDELLAHGRKMVQVGYVAGARSYFKRAAEAGSADAAFALGGTYDPVFMEQIGAQGIKPDVAQARIWYERAKVLGSKDAEAQLAALNREEALLAPAPAAASGPAPGASEPVTGGATSPEWVEISGTVNLRAAPTPQAETIKVAEPGTRYQATARKGSWVQVTDPATAEVGWVYSRYIASSDSPRP
ncbi:MAG: SH3 domain-containing protein [Methyloceanibacter sp.]